MADAPSSKNGGNGGNAAPRVHVLALSEESAHVRSLARSWAAGDVGLDDYRMIRSLTIEGMLSGELTADGEAAKPAAAASDDDDEHEVTAVGDETVAEGDDTDPNMEAVHERPPAPGASTAPRIALAAGAILLLIGLLLLLTLV